MSLFMSSLRSDLLCGLFFRLATPFRTVAGARARGGQKCAINWRSIFFIIDTRL
jgi:hypothetical protein